METKQIVVYPNDILTTPTKKTDLETAQKLAVEMFMILKKEGGLCYESFFLIKSCYYKKTKRNNL
jgi:peptide deformylase